MLRKMLLATSSLAVILVLFLVYHLGTGGAAETALDQAEEMLAETDLKLPEVSETQPVQELPQIKGVPIGEGGKKAWVTWYDKKTRQAKIQFRATTWEPLSDTEFHLLDLEVRMMMPGGQIAEIQADEGQILVSPGDLSEASVRRGWVKDNVQIRIDRTRPQWREQHPDRRDMAQHPDRVVRLWMDQLSFDLELSRLETKSAFRVQSAEVDLQGQGLLVRWNEDEDRIDFLQIARGSYLRFRGLKSRMDFALLNSEGQVIVDDATATSAPALEAKPVPEPEPRETEAGPAHTKAPQASPEESDLLLLDLEDEAHPRRPVTYRARFTKNVTAEQRRGLELLGKLEADNLALLFDSGQFEEVAAGGSETQPSEELEGKDGEPPADRTELLLTWDGPLIVEPQGQVKDHQEVRRFQIQATGNPVRLRDEQGSATCARLVFHNETGRLWLHGRPQAPVEVTAGPKRSLRAETLFYDGSKDIARLTGAGEIKAGPTGAAPGLRATGDSAVATASGKHTVIRWANSVELEITRSRFRVRDPETHEPKTITSPWIRRAVLDGDVFLGQPTQQARGQHLEIDFAPPQKPGRLLSDVHRFEGTGHVQLTRGHDDIHCDHLIIDMATTPDGRNVPTGALAEGHASARQRRRIIRARDSMTVTMAQIPRVGTQAAAEQARRLARAQGIDPDKMDPQEWARLQAEWAPKLPAPTETAIISLDARGEVRVDDPERELRLRADRLQCTFPDGRQIEQATVEAPPGRLAEVQLEDFAITGNRIELDVARTWALVPGPGEVEFYSDQDLDGRKLKEPLPVVVSWEGQMEMRGQANRLYFEQKVRATSTDQGREHYNLDCDKLSVNFIDLPVPQPIPQAAEPASRYWILDPLVRRWSGPPAERSSLLGDDGSDRKFGKKPVLMLADGNAIALYGGYAPGTNALQSRMRIAGPRIVVDLRRQSTNVEGAGNLLIENYRLPGPADRRRRPQRGGTDSVLGDWAGGGPSQTLFTWQNSMSFLTQRNVAIFDRNVQMTHRAGAEMKLVRRLAADQELEVAALQKSKGRRTSLDCANLLVEFARDPSAEDHAAGGTRSAELRMIEATGPVTLKDGSKTLVGDRLVYLRDSGLVTIRGGPGRQAHIYDEDRESGALRAHWRGPILRWNLNTNRIEAAQSTILLGGR